MTTAPHGKPLQQPRASCRERKAFLVATTVWLAMACACAAIEVTVVKHRGFDGAQELRAGKTTVVCVPSWAGRMSVLDFGSGNLIWQDAKLDGKTLAAKDGWMPFDGNATDIVGSDRKNQWKGLWLHAWPKVEKFDDGVLFQSEVSKETGLFARRVYRLSADGRQLSYAFAIACQEGEPRAWTIWERCLVRCEDYLICPLAQGGEFPDGWKVRDDTKEVKPVDRAQRVADFLVLRSGTEKGTGLAARLSQGWMAIVRGDQAFVLRWPLVKDGAYPHYGGAHAVFWIAEDRIELEPLSPEVRLQPGETLTLAMTWECQALPGDLKRDPGSVGSWLSAQARP